MIQLIETAPAQATFLLALALVVIAIAVYAAGRLRDRVKKDGNSASDLITNFREMHVQGVLSETEYRTIKTMLEERLQDELRDTDETG